MILERGSSGGLLIRTLGAGLPARDAGQCHACRQAKPNGDSRYCINCADKFARADAAGLIEANRLAAGLGMPRPHSKSKRES